ncbi:mannitol dehydrogenase family protein [Cellulomonas endophytica]|uniref:mannitol dehydrogenase family protein n=1 Tax=Cellulomonas endophytica TaxID=2494735 RepID=UPI0010130C8A|nr:mannitol dehydrogenase family protein [Cellulomonas endophytica]
MTELRPSTLADLDPRVAVPSYDRAAVGVGVVHLGVGGFHRAHQALYLDDVLASGDLGWGVCGVGLLPGDARVRDAVAAQDGLYTLVTTAPDGSEAVRVVGSLVRYLFAPDDPEAVLEVLAAPSTRIVSLTVTEGGYGVDDATGAFDPQDALTLADLAGAGTPGLAPGSALGFLAEGLRRRRAAGVVPFTVMSCDNIQGNGHVARTALTSFVRASDPALADWIAAEVAFPSSMVDRITPVPTPAVAADLAERRGVEDVWPVRSESFRQWVLEDRFTAGRPDLAAVGVQVVEDVEPFERMKLRLLNAGHQAVGHLGLLAGWTWVHDVCSDPTFRGVLRRYWEEEAVPTLGEVPGTDLGAYCDSLVARFSSEAVRDTLDRQVVDASDRIPKFLLPVVRDRLAAGGSVEVAALVIAAWGVRLERAAAGLEDAAPDRRHPALLEAVAGEAASPGALLRLRPVFGDLGDELRLVEPYLRARAALVDRGARAVLAEVAAGATP